MPSSRRVIHLFFLAHSFRGDARHCFMVPVGGLAVAVCARCLGLYPAMFLVLGAQQGLGLGPASTLDWWIALAGVCPALIDWGIGRLGSWEGHNAVRLGTGVLAGVGLGRSLFLHLHEPFNEVSGVQLMLICFFVLAVELVRWNRPATGSSQDGDGSAGSATR